MGKTVEEIIEITKDIVSFDMKDEDVANYKKHLDTLPPNPIIVDVGTGQAKTCIRLAFLRPDAQIWSWDWGHGHPENIPHEYFKMITDRLRDKGVTNVYFCVADSDKAWPTWNWQINALNVDASHSYDISLEDFKRWVPFVVSGGYIFIHDYNYLSGNDFKFNGLRQAVEEYFNDKEFEFLENHIVSQGGAGAGFLCIKKL